MKYGLFNATIYLYLLLNSLCYTVTEIYYRVDWECLNETEGKVQWTGDTLTILHGRRTTSTHKVKWKGGFVDTGLMMAVDSTPNVDKIP